MMAHRSGSCRAHYRFSRRSKGVVPAMISLFGLVLPAGGALAQPVDCARLQAQIAAFNAPSAGGVSHSTGAAQRQRADLDRAITYARSLGCDRPPYFSGAAQARCPGLNAQIQQMQSNLAQINAAAGSDRAGGRGDLIARYNAYCRNPVQTAQPHERGFFEQLFGGGFNFGQPAPPPVAPTEAPYDGQETAEERPHGGSQAVCVRQCDGGFFPLSIPARRADPDQLTELCQALCPNAAISVYTKAPYSEIKTAVSLEGAAYSEMPNALKFQKSFDPTCTCKPPDESWAQALEGAERLLGQERKGDILVTDEKSAELSAIKPDAKALSRSDGGANQNQAAVRDPGKAPKQTPVDMGSMGEVQEVVGPDGVKRRVRRVGPVL